ncbi:MAG: saccharopine dehydrogenase NADP-binding domain-containing protein [Flavobacteriales bacterium]|nr:saccharopine dehydrogenase NADP-binding domain-containing protein [Flavobacteriales bacterium]
MENKDIIVYGAYGYTGELIVRKCQELGIKPLLSGRNEAKLKPIADKYGLSYLAADLQADDLDALLSGSKVVIHAAGPFIHTSKAMVEACIRNGVHYTDITGEIAVFAQARKYDEQAKKAGVMVLPGVGFDVVPSDCLAAHLKSRMADADDLVLAFYGTGRASRGTSLTVVEGLGYGGTIRENGKIKQVPDAYDVKKFDFGPNRMSAVTIPWGDVYTAFFSTGIPNIKVYMGLPEKVINGMKWSKWLGWLMRTEFVKNRARAKIIAGKAGPSDAAREKATTYLIGTVTDKSGKSLTSTIQTQEGYTLTAMTSVDIASKIASGNFKPGFQTPSLAYGKDIICTVSGAQFVDL